jgi:hypothetical protein
MGTPTLEKRSKHTIWWETDLEDAATVAAEQQLATGELWSVDRAIRHLFRLGLQEYRRRFRGKA